MENCLELQGFCFTYPNQTAPALRGVNLAVPPGAFVVLCGASGCGKTTLLRHLKPALAPHGSQSGMIFFGGRPLGECSARDAASKIGFVQQNPENQIVTDKVWHELAFGLESLGLDTPTIRLRVAEMASFFGIQAWFHRSVSELSGGQKQLLALACVMAMQPALLILDEPTSQLDPIAAGEFLAALAKINRELGTTVLLSEHRLEEAFPLCSHAVVMDAGRVIAEGATQQVGQALLGARHGMFGAMPTPMRIWAAVETPLPCPVTVRDGRAWLSQCTIVNAQAVIQEEKANQSTPAIALENVWFRYEKEAPDVVKGLSFQAHHGEITAILGGNGTGKTTVLSLIAGLQKAQRGKVNTQGRVAVLPQDPQSLFVGNTVEEDLLEMLTGKHLSKDEKHVRIQKMARLCRLGGLLQRHPYDLSGGEQQRAALAKVLLTEPGILLLDEPTKGFDAAFKHIFAGILHQLTAAGAAVVMVSHDIEFCAEYADRCALFFDGGIVTQGTPRSFFAGNSFYTSAANRMARHMLPAAVTAADVIHALGGDPQPPPVDPQDAEDTEDTKEAQAPPPSAHADTQPKSKQKKKPSRRSIATAATILLAMPLTIFAGIFFLGDRKYVFIALLLLLEAMLPFALLFEKRKPQARELVILAVLTALAVAGRTAFFMLPQFKPVVALVIIAGVAFGGESGFLVGALTGLVSNLFFGQGPWTPWQMFAFGSIGFLAGVLFKKGRLPRGRILLCAFGGLATFLIYGGLLNSSQVWMYQAQPTPMMFIAASVQGLPFDLIHALGTVVFLAVLAQPMLQKLNRIKVKYGLTEPSDAQAPPPAQPNSPGEPVQGAARAPAAPAKGIPPAPPPFPSA
ncbi:MAG: ATP-binding cassette domain-containing protein [Oscillospiraceae bacterium]|nr:ATP-binding cassette domain-containing protein [Oscillospiraceae bacterium]